MLCSLYVQRRFLRLVFSIFCVYPFILVFLPLEAVRCMGFQGFQEPIQQSTIFLGQDVQEIQGSGELVWLLWPEESSPPRPWWVGACLGRVMSEGREQPWLPRAIYGEAGEGQDREKWSCGTVLISVCSDGWQSSAS